MAPFASRFSPLLAAGSLPRLLVLCLNEDKTEDKGRLAAAGAYSAEPPRVECPLPASCRCTQPVSAVSRLLHLQAGFALAASRAAAPR